MVDLRVAPALHEIVERLIASLGVTKNSFVTLALASLVAQLEEFTDIEAAWDSFLGEYDVARLEGRDERVKLDIRMAAPFAASVARVTETLGVTRNIFVVLAIVEFALRLLPACETDKSAEAAIDALRAEAAHARALLQDEDSA